MPKRDPNLPGDVVFTPGSWQQALAEFLRECTELVKDCRTAIAEQSPAVRASKREEPGR